MNCDQIIKKNKIVLLSAQNLVMVKKTFKQKPQTTISISGFKVSISLNNDKACGFDVRVKRERSPQLASVFLDIMYNIQNTRLSSLSNLLFNTKNKSIKREIENFYQAS